MSTQNKEVNMNQTSESLTSEVKPDVKMREVIPGNTVKMIYGGITRIVPKNKVNEFKKKGYVEMT